MIDVIHDAEKRFFNTIPLNSLLQEADLQFREAVIGALVLEGFELNESLPCLHHPMEILESIHCLETLDSGTTWELFRQALLAAGEIGILMDLSNSKAKPLPGTSSFQTGQDIDYHSHQLGAA